MHEEDGKKLSKIEDLKSKLFSKNFQIKIEHRDNFSHNKTREVMDSWKVEDKSALTFSEKFFMQTALFKKFFIFSIAFLTLALLYGTYMFFAGGNTVSNNNIDISILGNTFTDGGEELPLQISITNKNTLPLLLVDLVIEYPKNSTGDLSGDTEYIRYSLGTIPSGTIRNENIKVILFGEQGSIRPIKMTLEYRVDGSNAIFVKEKLYEVNINSTPINLVVDAPTEVSPNQDIALNIKSTLNSTKPATAILTKVEYPVGFQFISSVPAPSFGNNIWSFGDLAPGGERDIKIVGRMIDVFDGEEKTFKIWSGSQSVKDKSSIDVVFNSLGHTFAIKKPFIEANFLIAGVKQREYAVNSNGSVTGEIRWVNNLESKVNNLQIRAKISGNSINRKTIKPENGFYDSATDEVIWDKNYIGDFAEINPRRSGSVFFTFAPLSLFSSTVGVTVNPIIKVDVSISGQQEIFGYESKELRNSDSSTIKIISDAGFAAKVFYYSGPFANTGPIPPKVQEKTTYTVVWSLSNSSNAISKGMVRSSLPPWVNFVGPISPATEDLAFNSSTKELVWNVGNIARGVGVTSPSREVAFKISLSPSLSQVGAAPTLIEDAVLTGVDGFANVNIRVNKSALDTRLINESNFPVGGERVVE